MKKNLQNDMLAKSQQNKAETCLPVSDYISACCTYDSRCADDPYDYDMSEKYWKAREKFYKQNGPGGFNYDFTDR